MNNKLMQVWTVNNGNAYVLPYSSRGAIDEFEKSLLAAQNMIDSFKIIPARISGKQA